MSFQRRVDSDEFARRVAVDNAEYNRIRDMAEREPYLAGALDRLCRAICAAEMEFPVDALTEFDEFDEPLREKLKTRIIQQFWAPLAREYVRSKFMFGFFVYQLTKRLVVVSDDGNFVRLDPVPNPKHASRTSGEAATIANTPYGTPLASDIGRGARAGDADADAGADADADDAVLLRKKQKRAYHVVVPTVPDASTYRLFVGLTREREKHIICEPVEDEQFEPPKIKIFYADKKWLPDANTGKLCSPLASLLGIYQAYALYEECELQAVYASTNLPVVYQPVPQKEIQAATGIEAPLAGATLLGTTESGEPPTMQVYAAVNDMAARQIEENERRAGPSEKIRVGLTHERTVTLRNAMQGPTHFVPMDKALAGNVPVPSVPTGLAQRFEMYRLQISVALGIPASFLGSPMHANFSVNGDIDSGEFVATLNNVTRDVEFAMGEIYYVVLNRMGAFRIPFFSMQPIERIRDYFSIGAIDHATVRDTVFRMTGLRVARGDTRETEMPIEGFIALKRLQLDEKKMDDTHDLTKAQIKTMAADVTVKAAQAEAQTAAAKESAANAAAARKLR